MSEKNKDNSTPLAQLVRNLFNMFLPTPDIYPITYYKKGKHFRRY
jgi:hypothetical protein